MDCNIKVLLWSMKVDDKSDCGSLEHNLLQFDNRLWNVIGSDKSNWDRKELNALLYEGFNTERDRRRRIRSGRLRTECITTCQYTMKDYGRQRIRLVKKKTERN